MNIFTHSESFFNEKNNIPEVNCTGICIRQK